jgi:hypothetical protein
MPKLTKCLVHRDRKSGALLQFTGDDLKMQLPSGALVNVVRGADGQLHRPVKLTKKQRRLAHRPQPPLVPCAAASLVAAV